MVSIETSMTVVQITHLDYLRLVFNLPAHYNRTARNAFEKEYNCDVGLSTMSELIDLRFENEKDAMWFRLKCL